MHLVSILVLEAKPASETLVLDPNLTLPVSLEILSSFHYVPCLVRESVRIKMNCIKWACVVVFK